MAEESLRFGKIMPNESSKSRDAPKKGEPFRNEKKGRLQALITYASETEIKDVVEYHDSQIRYWTAILHDKDVDEEGNPVESHHHLVIECYDPYSIKTIRKWFGACRDNKGEVVTTLSQLVIDRRSICDYLTHKSQPNKHQYKEDELINYPDYCKLTWVKPRQDDQPSLRIIDDLLHGVSQFELIQRYGREYIINSARYREAVSLMVEDMSLPKDLTDDQKIHIYQHYRRY